MRLAQIVHTVTEAADVGAVRILLGAEPIPGPGEDPGALITLGSIAKREVIGPVPVGIAAVQRRLVALRYLATGMVNGRLDYRTSQALARLPGVGGARPDRRREPRHPPAP